jgi:sporulation protein YlmC with PRC-barrel domain
VCRTLDLPGPWRCSLGAVTETTVYEMGVPASCTDGFCGNVNQFVFDTATLVVTHLVVEPEHRGSVGKLVPVRLVEAADDSVEIDCDLAEFDALADAEDNSEASTSNAVLPGHLAVRGDRPVHSTDGEIGKIRAAVVEAGPGRITHILLQEGHLWGKREVAIPWESVTSLDDGVRLNLTSEVIKELPPVPF